MIRDYLREQITKEFLNLDHAWGCEPNEFILKAERRFELPNDAFWTEVKKLIDRYYKEDIDFDSLLSSLIVKYIKAPHLGFTEANLMLYEMLPQEQVDLVFNHHQVDIEPDFLGFVDTYYYLSKLIPTAWTVVDLGCAYNPQCYFFREHKEYIAVDFPGHPRFSTPNCQLVESSIEDYLENGIGSLDKNTTFAICNYVNTMVARELSMKAFPNCYCYYPCSKPIWKQKKSDLTEYLDF